MAFDRSIATRVSLLPAPASTGLAPRLVERDLDHALLLLLGHGGALAGGAAGHEHVDPARHLALHQPPQRRLVERSRPSRTA